MINVFALNINDVCYDDICLLHPKQQQRILNIKNENAKKQAFAAELLVLYVVKKFKPKNVPIPPLRAAGEFGKPYFSENEDFKFNISHSGEWAVIAVSDCEIGIDIEKIAKLRTGVAKRVLSEQEKQQFFKLDIKTQQQRFYDYWVLKESIVKTTGRGMYDSFRDINIHFSKDAKIDDNRFQLFLFPFNDKYKMGICIMSNQKHNICLQKLSYNQIIK